MRGHKTRRYHRPYPRKEHRTGVFPDHDSVLDAIVADHGRYGIPDYGRLAREEVLIEGPPKLTPDLVFYHDNNSVTVVEAGTSPYRTKRESNTSRLVRARKHFRDTGVKCSCMVAYLVEGVLKVETPIEIAFMEVEEERGARGV